MHQRAAAFSRHDQHLDGSLPLVVLLLCLWEFHDVVGGVLQREQLATIRQNDRALEWSVLAGFRHPFLITVTPNRRKAQVSMTSLRLLDVRTFGRARPRTTDPRPSCGAVLRSVGLLGAGDGGRKREWLAGHGPIHMRPDVNVRFSSDNSPAFQFRGRRLWGQFEKVDLHIFPPTPAGGA
jgi:hypothetical protein